MDDEALVDTGALLALLDRDDRWHRPCVGALVGLRLPLHSSLAVLTELCHLVRARSVEEESLWKLVDSGAIRFHALGDTDVPELRSLVRKYRDRPMDLADATLVLLARRLGVSTVFTVDHDDFETYRIEGRRRFVVVPARA